MKVSKNQVVWARCHLVGLTSGIDCTTQSSGSRSAQSPVVKSLISRNRASRRSARDRPVCECDRPAVVSPIAGAAIELKRCRLPARFLLGAPGASDRAPLPPDRRSPIAHRAFPLPPIQRAALDVPCCSRQLPILPLNRRFASFPLAAREQRSQAIRGGLAPNPHR